MPRKKTLPPRSLSEVIEAYPTIRQSRLADFDDCRLSALFGLEGGGQYTNDAQARGILFHRAAAKVLQTLQGKKKTKMTVGEALPILYEVCRQADISDEDVVFPSARERRTLRIVFIKFVHENEFGMKRLVAVERRLNTEVEYHHHKTGELVKRTITGAPDAILLNPPTETRSTVGATILDWKTTRKAPPAGPQRDGTDKGDHWDDPEHLSYHGYFQQRFYGLLGLRNFPSLDFIELREFYPFEGVARYGMVKRSDMESLVEEFTTLVQLYDRGLEGGSKSKIYAPSPGKHCFSGRTRFLTDRGVRTLKDACGETVRVLDRHGKWVEGKVESFGVQPLVKVTFDGKEVEEVTPDHLWWTMEKDRHTGAYNQTDHRVTTMEVDRVPVAQHAELPDIDPEGVRHGVVYGDGHLQGRRNWSLVRLQPHKAELADWFDSSPVVIEHLPGQFIEHNPILRRADGVVDISLQPAGYKDLPVECSPEYARGFIAGLVGTDGSVCGNGGITVSCEGFDKAQRIAEIARLGGCVVSSVLLSSSKVPAEIGGVPLAHAGEPRETMKLALKPATTPVLRANQRCRLKAKNQMRRIYRRVVDIEQMGPEEVYCLVVPGSESFTLASGLVTSNCSYCPAKTRCPLDALDRVHAGGIASWEEARMAAGEYVQAKYAKEEMHDALKAWVVAHGPIDVKNAKGRMQLRFHKNKTGNGQTFGVWVPETSDRGPYDEEADAAIDEAFAEVAERRKELAA